MGRPASCDRPHSPPTPLVPDFWYYWLASVLSRTYYHRIALVGAAPARGHPTCYIALHRNGAVDGLVYKSVFPRVRFLIAAQLLRNAFARLFFTGIPVVRAGDRGDRRLNDDSLARCVEHLRAGGDLCVLPEGTSDLGPRHLPFRSGIARILDAAVLAGVSPRLIPVGIDYEDAPTFRTDVTVVCGPTIDATLPPGDAAARQVIWMSRITTALEALSVDVEYAPTRTRLERMLRTAELSSGPDYVRALQAMARLPTPAPVAAAWHTLVHDAGTSRVATDRGAPVFSRRGLLWNLGWLVAQSLVLLPGTVCQLPVLLVAMLVGSYRADGRNTIALWRLLAGTPTALLWNGALVVGAVWAGRPTLLWALAGLTGAALLVYPFWRTRLPRLANLQCAGGQRQQALVVVEWVHGLAAGGSTQSPPAGTSHG